MGIVLIADIGDSRDEITLDRPDLEFAEQDYVDDLLSTLCHIHNDVTFYPHPKLLIENADRHTDDVVLSLWSGVSSRCRRALVPAICEAYGIRYIGADAYASVICQDKSISKSYAKRYGFASPASVLVDHSVSFRAIEYLKLPLVVKPNFEGGSIGISTENLVHSHDEAWHRAVQLRTLFAAPALIEEFIEGPEVSLVLCGTKKRRIVGECIQVVIPDETVDLERSIWGYELKKLTCGPDVFNLPLAGEIPNGLIENGWQLFSSFPKLDFLRIDGRLQHNDFSLIELSPDVHFGRDCTMYAAFSAAGITYEGMFKILLDIATQGSRVLSTD
jgi:D-alanine-D-alanine ligase